MEWGGEEHPSGQRFFDGFLVPFGRTWGGVFAPTEVCVPVAPPTCSPGTSFDPFATIGPDGSPLPTPCIPPTPAPTHHGKPTPEPTIPLPTLPLPTPAPTPS